MYRYNIWRKVLETDIDFPELERSGPVSEHPSFRLIRDDAICTLRGVPYHTLFNSRGEAYVRLSRIGEDCLVQVWDSIFFVTNPQDGSTRYCADTIGSTASLRHQFLNLILPILNSVVGGIVLHGSAVEENGSAIVFVGKGGSGKSTLAAMLSSMFSFSLLADDAVYLEGTKSDVLVHPSYNGIRLTSESQLLLGHCSRLPSAASSPDKQFLRCQTFTNVPTPLAALYFVNYLTGCCPTVRKMSPSASFAATLGHSHMIDPGSPRCLSRQFECLSRMAIHAACFSFSYPRSAEATEQSLSVLVQHVKALGQQ